MFHHPQQGKGDFPRPCNKKEYDRNYLRLFGKKCPNPKCYNGILAIGLGDMNNKCPICDGLGYVEKGKK